MFARHARALANPVCACATVLTLAAVSVAAVPAHGFTLESFATNLLRAAARDLDKRNPHADGKPQGRESAERSPVDDMMVRKAAHKAERAMWKVGEVAWKKLEKTKSLGPVLKKLGKRWALPVVAARSYSPLVSHALAAWDLGRAAGSSLIAPKVVAAIERRFEARWQEQEAELHLDMLPYRMRRIVREQGLPRDPAWRRNETVSNMPAAAPGAEKAREDGQDPWAQPDDPWGERGEGASAAARAAGDPWAPEAAETRAAPVSQTGPSNYEKALTGVPGRGPQPAGYARALEKLEADRRAEEARRQAEAAAARAAEEARRQAEMAAAHAAEEARRQAEMAAAHAAEEARRQAEAAADRRWREELHAIEMESIREKERIREDNRRRAEDSRRRLNESVHQIRRNLQMLQQTRDRQQERARERAQREQARQEQLILQQARDRQRQAYREQQQEQARQERVRQEQERQLQLILQQNREQRERERQDRLRGAAITCGVSGVLLTDAGGTWCFDCGAGGTPWRGSDGTWNCSY